MAVSNKERQRKWREKNGARYNLERRNARKAISKRGDAESTVCTGVPERENDRSTVPDAVSEILTPAAPQTTISYLRSLEKAEREKPRVEAFGSVRMVRRSETGMIITEEQWEKRQEYKRIAREKGFEPDEYSQA